MANLEDVSKVAGAILNQINSGVNISKSNGQMETGYNINPNTQTGAAALRRESLAQDIKNLTFGTQQFTLFPIIPRVPADNTVMQYTVQDGYGQSGASRYVSEGAIASLNLPDVNKKFVAMKYLSDTRNVSLQALAANNSRSPLDVQTDSAMMTIAESIEQGLFYGDADLTDKAPGNGKQFDGLYKLVDKKNVIDLKGESLTEQILNNAAVRVAKGFGVPSDAFMPIGVQADFVSQQLNRQVVLQQAPEGIASGFNINAYQSTAGVIKLHGSTIMDRGNILDEQDGVNLSGPAAPSEVTASIVAGEKPVFKDEDVLEALNYKVRVVSTAGNSLPALASAKLTDTKSNVALDIRVAGLYQEQPTHVEIFREDPESHEFYRIGLVGFNEAKREADGFHISFTDVNDRIPGTADVFVGELQERTIGLYEWKEMQRLPLAQVNASINFTILWWGALGLFAPKRWAIIKNVKARVY